MIKSIKIKQEKGRIYANIERNSIEEGEKVLLNVINKDGDNYFEKYLPNDGYSVKLDLSPYCKACLTGKLTRVFETARHYALNQNLSVEAVIEDPIEARAFSCYTGYEIGIVSENEDIYGLLTRLPYLQISKGPNGDTDLIRVAVISYDDDTLVLKTDQSELGVSSGSEEDIVFCNT